MYVPRSNALQDEQIRDLVRDAGSGELITVGDDGFPLATRLPLVWVGDEVLMHLAVANPHWRCIEDGRPGLVVVTGPEAYVSAGYYPSKAEHGRVVPTWNYSAVHLTGRMTLHREPEWLRQQIELLTDAMETSQPEPWQVSDAPEPFVEQMLGAIVGVSLRIERVEAKAKLSQNRTADDQAGVVAGLRRTGRRRDADVADAMEQISPRRA